VFLLNIARAIGAIALTQNFLRELASIRDPIGSLRTKRDGSRNGKAAAFRRRLQVEPERRADYFFRALA
jgi:hypothetical protein